MTTLNARANQAWRDESDLRHLDEDEEFSGQRHAFEAGWETGYKTAVKEIAEAFEPALYNSPDGDDFAHTHPPEEGEPECPAPGVWTDITADVRQSSGITVTRGKSDEQSQTQPQRLTFTLNNMDGKYSPRNPLTRSVEIPERVADALGAALPYLAPAPVIDRGALFNILVEFIMAQPERADVVEYDEVLDQIMALAPAGLGQVGGYATSGGGAFSDSTNPPARDGGLREALEKLAAEYEQKSQTQSYSYPEANAYVDGQNGVYENASDAIRDLLAAHPAAPAVSVDTAKSTASTSAIPQPAGESATKLDCGICYRDDSDPEKVVFTYLAECGNHGRY